jgi:tetratricopeptide (TPR) repeat protein
MKRKNILIFLFVFFHINLFASGSIPAENILLLNYDSVSEGLGGSVLAFSKNALSFVNSPSSNYDVLAAKLDFAGLSAFDNVYGGACSLLFPTAIGNFTVTGAYDKFSSLSVYTRDGKNLSNSYTVYLNYVLPFIKKIPIYDNVGGFGITLKECNLSIQDNSKIDFILDIGTHYKLGIISDNLWCAAVFRNVGNKVNIPKSQSFDMPQNFDFALRYNFYGALKSAFMCDVIQFFKTNKTGYILGFEVTPFYPAIFRVGWRDYNNAIFKGITAGLSLNFESINIDYALSFMASGYDVRHAVSIGFLIGNVLNASKAYEYYLGVNFNKAKEAYRRKDYINARQILEEILTLYPDHEPSKKYLKEIAYNLAANDKALDIAIHKYLAKADRQFQRNNLLKAQKYYKKVLGIDAENSEAQKGIEKIQDAIKTIKIQKNRQENADKIISLWKEGVKLYKNRNFVFAKERFEQILDIDPENSGALKYLGLIETKVNKITTIQMNDIFNQAMKYYKNKDYENASKYFSTVYTTDPVRNDAKSYYELSIKALNKNNPSKKTNKTH